MKMDADGQTNKITLKYDFTKDRDITEEAESLTSLLTPKLPTATRQLKRLPHVFNKFLALPFPPTTVEERQDCYIFVVQKPGLAEMDMEAEAMEIIPGATRVALRGAERMRELENDVDRNPNRSVEWRHRLPSCAIADAARTSYEGGILTITIPKVL